MIQWSESRTGVVIGRKDDWRVFIGWTDVTQRQHMARLYRGPALVKQIPCASLTDGMVKSRKYLTERERVK